MKLGGASIGSMAALWRARVAATPSALAFESLVEGAWTPMTWRQADERVRRIAAGLVAKGVQRGDRVAILAGTRLEWVLADFGILCAGAACTTIYPSSTADEAAYVLADAGCVAVIAEDAEQVGKLHAEVHRLGELALRVVIDPTGCDEEGWISLEALEQAGADHLEGAPGTVDERIDALGPEDLATLIYTSGTTGRPKGVVLAHDNWLMQADAVEKDLGPHQRPGDKQYLFLPLAHSFGKICELMAVVTGVPTAIEGRIDLIVDGLAATRPTIMCAVPRVFEKINARIVAGARDKGPRTAAILGWARRVGDDRLRCRDAGTAPGLKLRLESFLADKLVFQRLRDGMGGRIRAFVSGGAPLAPEIARFFDAAGMVIIEGYGLTETAAAAISNKLDDYAFGTVGRPIAGCELRIAEDGEILLRGRNVMVGYWNRPDATAEALDDERWLHTGDLGSLDEHGRLRVTGRKKDIIVTSGGKNVAPLDIEGRIKGRCPLIAEIVMQGDRRPYCVALVWLDPEAVKAREERSGRNRPFEAASQDPALAAEVTAVVDEINAGLPSYATIKRTSILDHPIDPASGLLTPSMKVKRNLVAARYQERLDEMYAR
ncbi:MAG: long-chain fatty acid--CoA ligase [Alphaproteobacteria bacterium]|nr:long-chain fatty acid--CoA ligase [Alphaproteobacteria bacterium]